MHRVQRVPVDRGAGPHPHLDRDGIGPAGGGRGRDPDRREGPADRRLSVQRPRRPERQHHRQRRAHHAPADRADGRHPGREEPAQEPGQGDVACCARGCSRWSRSARRRSAATSGGRRSGRGERSREDPHLQLPRRPGHRSPHRPDRPQPAGAAGGGPRPAHRAADRRPTRRDGSASSATDGSADGRARSAHALARRRCAACASRLSRRRASTPRCSWRT